MIVFFPKKKKRTLNISTSVIPMEPRNSKFKKFIQRCLKISNVFLAIAGIAILLYSVWMFVFCLRHYRKYHFRSWFLWTCVGTGIMFCFTACIGHVAAYTRNGLFLSFYILLVFMFLLVEILVTADVLLNDDWEEDFPKDPTQRFDDFVHYVDSNWSLFVWIIFLFLLSQVTSFTLAMILRTKYAKVKSSLKNYEDEQVSAARAPFLDHHNSIVNLPYVVGHPHPPIPYNIFVDDNTLYHEKDSLPYSDPEVCSNIANHGCPP